MKVKNKHIVLSFFLIMVFAVNGQTLSIKVMSMNMREGGQLANFNAEAFSACIRIYNPDVVVFQEMDNFTTRNGKKDLLSEMAVQLGMFPYYGKAFTYSGGDFGNGILSKYPFFNAKNITSQPVGAREMRACAWIDILMPNKQKVRVAVTHLDVASDEQVRISTLATINTNILTDNTIPTLLIGDFNASPNSDTMNYAKIKWQDIGVGTGNTINSTNQTSRIDYVMGYPKNWVKKKYEIVCYPSLSDHCFVVAEVEYPSIK